MSPIRPVKLPSVLTVMDAAANSVNYQPQAAVIVEAMEAVEELIEAATEFEEAVRRRYADSLSAGSRLRAVLARMNP